MKMLIKWVVLVCFMVPFQDLALQAEISVSTRPLYIIFDGSNSMWGELSDKSRKIEVAKEVFNNLDPLLFKGREVALRLYGHRRASDCKDTELAVPFGSADTAIERISKRVNSVTPRGKTPISLSLRAALDDFGDRGGEILLISDGIETCDTDPCDLVESWREKNIDIRVHVVGLGLDEISRGAMQCIAEASGTRYLDAKNTGELSFAIKTAAANEPPSPDEPVSIPQVQGLEFKITGIDQNGNFVPVQGTLSKPEFETKEVRSNFRYEFPGGQYSIHVGVPTVNGVIYKPVTLDIQIEDVGRTRIEVTLARPPTIRTRFLENGKEIPGAIATAYQEGSQQYSLRPAEEYFVLPGVYEFRAQLNKDNVLVITETIADGDDKTIDFFVVETVRAWFVVKPEGSNNKLRQHQQLYQEGKLKYKVHHANGADIQPGVYTLRSNHPLTPYEIEQVEVTGDKRQGIELSVPMASVQLNYVFLEEPATTDRRCWLERIDAKGKSIHRSKGLSCSGAEIVLSAGRYRVKTWSKLGEFEPAVFEIKTGESKQVDVQQIELP